MTADQKPFEDRKCGDVCRGCGFLVVWCKCKASLEDCPKCGEKDALQHVKAEPYGIETHYDECSACGFRSEPE